MSLMPTVVYSGFQGDPTQGPTTTPYLQADFSRVLYVSTISTSRIQLDGNSLDTTGSGGSASLLLNGSVVASASNLTSSLANWAQYGANSTITFATGGGTGGSLIMSNVSSLYAQAGTGTFQSLTISTVNGQTIPQIGQTVAYKNTSTCLSSKSWNPATSNAILLTNFANAQTGIVQGTYQFNVTGGTMGVSNAGSGPPVYAQVYVSDNSNYPYTPLSAYGQQTPVQDWYPIGPISNPPASATVISQSINCPYAFSNAGSNLFVVAQNASATPWGTLVFNTLAASQLAVYGGATVVAL